MSLEAILYTVWPSMTEQEYVFILSLYSSSTYYVYGVTLFELFISLTYYNCITFITASRSPNLLVPFSLLNQRRGKNYFN